MEWSSSIHDSLGTIVAVVGYVSFDCAKENLIFSIKETLSTFHFSCASKCAVFTQPSQWEFTSADGTRSNVVVCFQLLDAMVTSSTCDSLRELVGQLQSRCDGVCWTSIVHPQDFFSIPSSISHALVLNAWFSASTTDSCFLGDASLHNSWRSSVVVATQQLESRLQFQTCCFGLLADCLSNSMSIAPPTNDRQSNDTVGHVDPKRTSVQLLHAIILAYSSVHIVLNQEHGPSNCADNLYDRRLIHPALYRVFSESLADWQSQVADSVSTSRYKRYQSHLEPLLLQMAQSMLRLFNELSVDIPTISTRAFVATCARTIIRRQINIDSFKRLREEELHLLSRYWLLRSKDERFSANSSNSYALESFRLSLHGSAEAVERYLFQPLRNDKLLSVALERSTDSFDAEGVAVQRCVLPAIEALAVNVSRLFTGLTCSYSKTFRLAESEELGLFVHRLTGQLLSEELLRAPNSLEDFIDAESFSAQIVRLLLVNPAHDTPENFLVSGVNLSGSERLAVIALRSDKCFVFDGMHKDAQAGATIKSVFLCSPRMFDAVDAQIVDRVRGWDISALLARCIADAELYTTEIEPKLVSNPDGSTTLTALVGNQRLFWKLFERLKSVQQCLMNSPRSSHFDLLRAVNAPLADFYLSKIFSDSPQKPRSHRLSFSLSGMLSLSGPSNYLQSTNSPALGGAAAAAIACNDRMISTLQRFNKLQALCLQSDTGLQGELLAIVGKPLNAPDALRPQSSYSFVAMHEYLQKKLRGGQWDAFRSAARMELLSGSDSLLRSVRCDALREDILSGNIDNEDCGNFDFEDLDYKQCKYIRLQLEKEDSKRLRHLSLKNCLFITNDRLFRILENCSSVMSIDIRNCALLDVKSSVFIHGLQIRCPSLRRMRHNSGVLDFSNDEELRAFVDSDKSPLGPSIDAIDRLLLQEGSSATALSAADIEGIILDDSLPTFLIGSILDNVCHRIERKEIADSSCLLSLLNATLLRVGRLQDKDEVSIQALQLVLSIGPSVSCPPQQRTVLAQLAIDIVSHKYEDLLSEEQLTVLIRIYFMICRQGLNDMSVQMRFLFVCTFMIALDMSIRTGSDRNEYYSLEDLLDLVPVVGLPLLRFAAHAVGSNPSSSRVALRTMVYVVEKNCADLVDVFFPQWLSMASQTLEKDPLALYTDICAVSPALPISMEISAIVASSSPVSVSSECLVGILVCYALSHDSMGNSDSVSAAFQIAVKIARRHWSTNQCPTHVQILFALLRRAFLQRGHVILAATWVDMFPLILGPASMDSHSKNGSSALLPCRIGWLSARAVSKLFEYSIDLTAAMACEHIDNMIGAIISERAMPRSPIAGLHCDDESEYLPSKLLSTHCEELSSLLFEVLIAIRALFLRVKTLANTSGPELQAEHWMSVDKLLQHCVSVSRSSTIGPSSIWELLLFTEVLRSGQEAEVRFHSDALRSLLGDFVCESAENCLSAMESILHRETLNFPLDSGENLSNSLLLCFIRRLCVGDRRLAKWLHELVVRWALESPPAVDLLLAQATAELNVIIGPLSR